MMDSSDVGTVKKNDQLIDGGGGMMHVQLCLIQARNASDWFFHERAGSGHKTR